MLAGGGGGDGGAHNSRGGEYILRGNPIRGIKAVVFMGPCQACCEICQSVLFCFVLFCLSVSSSYLSSSVGRNRPI